VASRLSGSGGRRRRRRPALRG